MEYFISHIGYILIAGVVCGLLAFAMVFLAEKNEANRDINEEKCNYHCESCSNSAICSKEGKKNV